MANQNSSHLVPPEKGFIRIHQVKSLLGIGQSTVWRWVASGKMPKPIKIGPRTTVWRAEEISAYLDKLSREGGIHE